MLIPKRRHTQTCSQRGTVGTECPSKSKLKCPYIIEWNEKVNGKRVRKEKSLGTNDYQTAMALVSGMVMSGKKELPGPPKEVEGTTVNAAIDKYFVEEASRGLAVSTLKSFHKFLDGNPKRNPDGDYSRHSKNSRPRKESFSSRTSPRASSPNFVASGKSKAVPFWFRTTNQQPGCEIAPA